MRLPRFKLSISPERRRTVYEEISELSAPTRSYYVRVAISTTIATYGLLANSTAVVIGAMLIAPLMGPISGIALGLASGDRRLLRQATISEALGALLAFGIAALVGLVPLNLGMGSEIVSRTQPTLYDLIVAVASGLAGAYASVDEKLSATLPGVAISTALVPPLATAGLCLSGGHPEWAFGAFLLFVANLVAIQIASAGIFIAYGLPRARLSEPLDANSFVRRFGASLVVLVAIGVFMTRTLVRLIDERRLSASVETVLREEVRRASGASLSSFDLGREGDGVTVVATVLTPQEFQPAQVGQIEDVLRQRIRPELHLVLRSLLSKDFDRDGAVYLPAVASEKPGAVELQTTLLRSATSVLDEQLASVPGARLAEVRREDDGDEVRLFALVRSPTAIEPSRVAVIQAALSAELGVPVSLAVRTVSARDADAARFIYEDAPRVAAASPEDLARRRRVEEILRVQFASEPGVTLSEVREFVRDGRTLVHAALRSPRALEPSEIARAQGELRREVSPSIDLVVRYALGADVSANGFATFVDGETPRIPPAWEAERLRKQLRFESNSARVPAQAKAVLDEVAIALTSSGAGSIVVAGYSDDRGSAKVNNALSLARARAVRVELIRRGVPAARIRLQALGDSQPLDANTTDEGRARNRRVEIRVEPEP